MIHNIDAQGKKLGRVACVAATFLMGKRNTNFVRNKVADIQVEISNVSKIAVDVKKLNDKEYVK